MTINAMRFVYSLVKESQNCGVILNIFLRDKHNNKRKGLTLTATALSTVMLSTILRAYLHNFTTTITPSQVALDWIIIP